MSEFTVMPKACSNNLPDKVKIGPIVFRLEQIPCPTVEDPEGNEIAVYGKINFKQALITIDSELEIATKWQCFYHEVFHAIMSMVGWDGGDGEEGFVDALAYAVLGFMLDNGFMLRDDFPAQETTGVGPVGTQK